MTSFFRRPGELQERCHFSRWYTGAMQTQLQTDGTLPVALRSDAKLTACVDWGAAGETVHQAEPGRGHAGRQAARWTHITRTQSQVGGTSWSCVEWFSDWCKNDACNWFIGSLNIKQCQRHLLKILISCTLHVKHAHINYVETLLESVNTPSWKSKAFIHAPHFFLITELLFISFLYQGFLLEFSPSARNTTEEVSSPSQSWRFNRTTQVVPRHYNVQHNTLINLRVFLLILTLFIPDGRPF